MRTLEKASMIFAHEIAHSMGAKASRSQTKTLSKQFTYVFQHDGDNNACKPTDGYIMMPSIDNGEGGHATNFKFSSCSITSMSAVLKTVRAARECFKGQLIDESRIYRPNVFEGKSHGYGIV
jgi:hypothetical protein